MRCSVRSSASRRTAPWTCISWWAWAPPTRASWWWADAGLPSYVSSISPAGRIPRRTAAPLLDETGLGLRLRFLSGGMSPAARLTAGKVLPERSGYYLGLRLVESYLAERGLASTVRAAAQEFKTADERALGIQTA